MMLKIPDRSSSSTAASRSSQVSGIRVSRPKKILDENQYNADLRKIISRDYFSTEESSGTPALSLDQYQARFTSEDNNDFNDLLETEDAIKRQKRPWLYNRKKLTGGPIKPNLLDGSGSSNGGSQKLIEYPPNSAQNALMFTLDNGSIIPSIASSHASRSRKQIVKHNVHIPSSSGSSGVVLGRISKPGRDELNGYKLIDSPIKSRHGTGEVDSEGIAKGIYKGSLEKRRSEKPELSPAAKRILQRIARKS